MSQIRKLPLSRTANYLPLLIISLEVAWTGIILLNAHPQVVDKRLLSAP